MKRKLQKIYKIQRDEFLVKYTEEHIVPKFAAKPTGNPTGKLPSSYEEEHGIKYPDDFDSDIPSPF